MTVKFDIAKLRLHAQHLAQPTFTQPAEVVAWFGAVQAQDYAGAKWSLAQRVLNATDHTIDCAFNDGEMIRTHVLRPTWHFVHPADLRWMLMLSAPRVHALNASQYRNEGLNEAMLARVHAVFRQALQGQQQLTRDELRLLLSEAGIDMQSQLRMTCMLMHAELEGLICSGPRRGKQFTYALLEARAPNARQLSRDDALAELVKRYFRSHGPATLHDFVWWSGLTMADAKRGVELAGDALSRWAVSDKSYWYDTGLPTMALGSRKAYLLPTYDEYLLSYADRSASLAPHLPHIWNRSGEVDTVWSSSIVLSGQVIGVWRRTLRKHSIEIEAKLFQPLTSAEEKAVGAAGKRLAEFYGLSETQLTLLGLQSKR